MLRRQIDDGEEKKEGDHEDAEQISFLENNGSSVSTSLEMIGKKEDKKDGEPPVCKPDEKPSCKKEDKKEEKKEEKKALFQQPPPFLMQQMSNSP